MLTIQTIPELFYERIRQSADVAAVSAKHDGCWVVRTWQEFADDVLRLAVGLSRCGVEPGDRIIQFSENRYEWLVVDMAIQLCQAVHVPVHATLSGPQAAYQIADSGAKVVFVSTSAQADKLRQVTQLADPARHYAPEKIRWYSFDPGVTPICGPLNHWRELLDGVTQPDAVDLERRAVKDVRPASLTTILYTSGTTGEPKGVMLTQSNLVTNALGAVEQFEMLKKDRRLNFLPLSHIFARLCDVCTWLVAGYELALAESRETVMADCATYRPTLLNGVPYFYDRVRRSLIERNVQDVPDVLRKALGGEIRLCASGGAALPDYVFDFFWQRGVPLLQGYGLTETSPVITMSSLTHVRRGAAGRALRDVDVRIADDGEILTRGPHVMLGYYGKPEATAEVIRDGWFHTGDLGRVDEDGFLFITGRKKELLVTTGGKKIAAVMLESLLTEDPLILQAVVIGDGRDFLTALIVPNPEPLRCAIAERGIVVASREETLVNPQVNQLYDERIRERLSGLSQYEQVRRFRLLDRSFTIENGELTPKLSLRRKEIETNFRPLIEEMYRKN